MSRDANVQAETEQGQITYTASCYVPAWMLCPDTPSAAWAASDGPGALQGGTGSGAGLGQGKGPAYSAHWRGACLGS